MKRFFPFIRWLPELGRPGVWRADVIAGLTVATILVPQAMAYAELAGLPPVYGLYAAFLPPAVAALFGSSRHLSTGPVAIASLISATTVQGLAPEGGELYIAYSLALGLLVGLIRIALGALRLGLLIDLLSGPVVVGFTNAAAFIIVISQLHKVFGVESQQGGSFVGGPPRHRRGAVRGPLADAGDGGVVRGAVGGLTPRSLEAAEHVDDAGGHHTRFLAGWI